jgi:proteasome accessory factor C
MPKATQTPLGRTARLLDLVPYLASHQGIELLTLAKEFDVSQSQMVADLTTLWMCGLPGYTPLELMELSFESGFVTIHNAETLAHPRTLSDEESIALLLGLDLVIESLPDDRKDLKTIALDLVARLSARSSLPAKLSAIPVIPGSIRSIIEKALRDKSGVEIVYHSSYSDTITRRTVLPIELRMENGSEYLWGVCQKASALRSFRVDRIQSVAVTTVEKIPTGAVQDNHKIEYTILAHSREREVMERFALKPDALGGSIEISSFSREWIRRSILASSGGVELVAPDDIRSEIQRAAQSILDRYTSQ